MQLKQVAAAQLELVTSESFDVYSPELEGLHSSRNSLPPMQETMRGATEESADEKRSFTPGSATMDELLPDEGIIEPAADNSSSHQEGLDKTVVLPDLRNEKLQQDVKRQNPARNTDEMSVLTADTIDLRNSLQQLQKDELSKEPHENYQTDSNMRKGSTGKTTGYGSAGTSYRREKGGSNTRFIITKYEYWGKK